MNEIEKYLSKTPSAKHWEGIGATSHNGIVLPLFSLRCEKSSGMGEYLDLIEVIDWIKTFGFDVIQLLPLNETSTDPSPYNAISSCALNPLHISLHALDGVEKNIELKEKLNEFKIFDSYQRVNYPKLKELKIDFLKEYYLYIIDDLKNDLDFKNFKKNHAYWLDEYCLFKSILQEQNYYSWEAWPTELQNINKKNFSKYKEKYLDEINFYSALQYFCFKQLEKVKKHATENNILLLGDVPIFVSKNSSDVWYNKSIFDLTSSAGVPPDKFNKYGQKWNFPLFNWDQLNKTNYQWWQRRLSVIANLYHMYRIDHAVGFFRTWKVPFDKYAKDGQFVPIDPLMWEIKGTERLLKLLHSSPLLPIAEDLGAIPEVVYYTLRRLGICGTKVMFWQKTLDSYLDFDEYDPISLTTISTHDSYTFQGWWENCEDEAMKFAQFKKWSYQPNITHSQRKELLTDSHQTSSIFHINLLQEYLALYPELVWPTSDDERINVPGTVGNTNWSYRFKPSFKEIISHKGLQKDLKDILS